MHHLRILGLTAMFGASALFAGGAPARAATDTTMPVCGASDQVVWENTKSGSKVYHLKGDKYFGNTKDGKYACKSAADAAGYHAASSMKGSSSASAAASPSPAPSASSKKHKHHKSSGSSSPAPSPAATST